MVKSSYYTSTLPYQTKGKNTDLKVERVSGLSHILKCFNKAILFCKAYGSIFAYYGAGFGAFFSALYVAFFNEYFFILFSDIDMKGAVSFRTCLK